MLRFGTHRSYLCVVILKNTTMRYLAISKDNSSDKPASKMQKAKTLLQHIEQIIECAEKSKFKIE